MAIRCVIIDDEPLARKGIREYVAEVDFLELAGEFSTATQATGLIAAGGAQLLFLDIQMPTLTGLEFIRTLKDPPPVIFTTAFPQYAIDGFEVNALDYLVKPVSFERFLKAALKAREFYEMRESNASASSPRDHLFIKAEQKLVRVNYDEILFVEALQNYVTLHTVAKKYITYLTFKAVEEYLPPDRFIRVHKSYIVSIDRVESIDVAGIRIGPHHIPISRNLKDEVMEKLLGGKYLKR